MFFFFGSGLSFNVFPRFLHPGTASEFWSYSSPLFGLTPVTLLRAIIKILMNIDQAGRAMMLN